MTDSESIDIDAEIAKLTEELQTVNEGEATLDGELQTLLTDLADAPREISHGLSRLKTSLALSESDASQLLSQLSLIGVLAEAVSGKVRHLDQAKTRVVDCLQRVEDILDLRECTEGVQAALASEDYEQAANMIHRFLTLDAEAVTSAEALSEIESLRNSCEVLRAAEVKLRDIITESFDRAVETDDAASIERFFKLFPLLNQHELGIDRFASYLRAKLTTSATKNYAIMEAGGQDDGRASLLYADTLTMLLEGVVRIIELHQPLVDARYGNQYLMNVVKTLQIECDFQSKRIIDAFAHARKYRDVAASVEAYVRASAATRATLPKPDCIALDNVLAEVTLMNTRVELYRRFLKRRVASDELESMLHNSTLNMSMQELVCQYIAVEEYFMRDCVQKALSTPTEDESSLVDDVVFIVRKCVRRSLTSSNADCVCATINYASNVLDTDFFNYLSSLVKAGYPMAGSFAEAYTTAAAAYSSVMQQGKVSEGAEKVRVEFIRALNNLDLSVESIKTLRCSLHEDIEKQFGKETSSARAKLDSCLTSLDDTRLHFEGASREALDKLVSSAVKPAVRQWSDPFNSSYTHVPTEAEFSDFEVNDPFVSSFLQQLDSLVVNFKARLTQRVGELFCARVAVEVAARLERVVMKAGAFNRLGGLQYDKDIREIVAYLTAVTSWSVREKLARLTQIAQLLNVESVSEVSELWPSGSCVLAPNEVRKFLALRIDLPSEDVRHLKL